MGPVTNREHEEGEGPEEGEDREGNVVADNSNAITEDLVHVREGD